MNARQARIQAIRDRGWKRYVKHAAPHRCRYTPRCPIAHQQNLRDADLAMAQLRVGQEQTTLWDVR